KGTYPPTTLYDKEGRPTLSWRVALLPYLGEEALYKEFKLDEPWDSLHNKKLLKKMPKALQAPSSRFDDFDYIGRGKRRGKTRDLVFAGEDTPFGLKKSVRKADVGNNA